MYRPQIGGKSKLDKTCRCEKKVDRGDVNVNGVHCILNASIIH